VIGHVGGVPVEKTLPALAGTSRVLLLARARLVLRVRLRPEPTK
jgi:hypothetical protein